jgi:CBS domain-containing protein
MDDTPQEPSTLAITAEDLRRSLHSLMKTAFEIGMDANVADAIDVMKTKRVGCVFVTKDKRLMGLFTERDVLKKIVGSNIDLHSTPITSVMTYTPQVLWEDDTIAYALNFMDLGGYRHIPIVNRKFEPVGVVSVKDIVSYLVQNFSDEILNLPPHPQIHADEPELEYDLFEDSEPAVS